MNCRVMQRTRGGCRVGRLDAWSAATARVKQHFMLILSAHGFQRVIFSARGRAGGRACFCKKSHASASPESAAAKIAQTRLSCSAFLVLWMCCGACKNCFLFVRPQDKYKTKRPESKSYFTP